MADLIAFLKNNLHIAEEDITNTKLERLYKILDLSKAGKIY